MEKFEPFEIVLHGKKLHGEKKLGGKVVFGFRGREKKN